ncbi:isoprenoid synthase domain-containing protein [Rhodofomes roseus]|uniref:Isoprenoid synthase domain-containing protein n=1 Tax=Rhodofomes roseus TaxID=34475 RepID=A0ABQ8K2E8_9APHY|nr:isoprenoid synthase domain-containing protein [Rhodofomes roseus]KAH9830403.1 isoprenoid synthase domain-containing protein [Rhodofomes roseus]
MSLKDVAQLTIANFLKNLDFTATPRFTRKPELEARVKAITQTWPSAGDGAGHPHVTTGIVVAETSYSHHSIDVQVAVALYTAVLTAFDNPDFFRVASAHRFPQMLCDGSAQQDQGLIGELARLLVDIGRMFPAFGTNCIIAGTLRWFAGEMIGSSSAPLSLESLSTSFIDFHRNMNGNPDAYVAFVWSKEDFPDETSYIHIFPEACIYMNQVNDILSFYKEELAGETSSYIHSRARVTGKTMYETLGEVIEEVVVAVERIREHLGQGPARDAWDNFEAGYVWFHILDPRYRLQEILGTEYTMD